MEQRDIVAINNQPHALLLPYPGQGHINPMLQFGKRLVYTHNLRASIAITRYMAKCTQPEPGPVSIETISDGFDQNGFAEIGDVPAYLDRLSSAGSKSLSDLISSLRSAGRPVQVLIYDGFLTWAVDVAKRFGLASAAFFTQSCAVDALYWHVYDGRLKIPAPEPVESLPGLPRLEPRDLPSLMTDPEPAPYPAYLALLKNQYINLEEADVVLINSFYELERKEFDWMKTLWRVKSIGPTVPSAYLDNRIPSDKHYGFNLFTPDSEPYLEWLDTKPPASVIYASFGSMAALSLDQFEELASGLADSNKHFLWVVRKSELSKLPKNFLQDTADRGLVVTWCNQLDVLSHRAIGCFVTHCGWNSVTEAIGLGVPMVGMPQWTDQSTNAKYLEDVWGVGVRVKEDEKGVVSKEEVVRCVKEVMEGERSAEIKKNAAKWKVLSKGAVGEGGSSDKNIAEFIEECCY